MSMPERLRQAVNARFGPMNKPAEQQFQTREKMLGELEHRGYRARGKTDEQIVQMLKHVPRESAELQTHDTKKFAPADQMG